VFAGPQGVCGIQATTKAAQLAPQRWKHVLATGVPPVQQAANPENR